MGQFFDFLFASQGNENLQKGSTFKGENSRLEEQIHFCKSFPLLRQEANTNEKITVSPESDPLFQKKAYWWFVNLGTTGQWQMARYYVGEHTSPPNGISEESYPIQWFVR